MSPANPADSRRLVIFGTEYAKNAERHGLLFKYKAVASVSPVSSAPKYYPSNPADSHGLVILGTEVKLFPLSLYL